jgi:hypothetical protein
MNGIVHSLQALSWVLTVPMAADAALQLGLQRATADKAAPQPGVLRPMHRNLKRMF